MLSRKKVLVIATVTIASLAGVASASMSLKTPVEFYKGHTHEGDVTIDAPQHSGGTDRYGCHNASVPYHCH
jgi:hypothetical protein